jgi:hypothetical protein
VPARRIQIVAAVVGAASLGAEIAAARLLAPWFGASTIIWANTIATVLVRCRPATGSAGASPTATRRSRPVARRARAAGLLAIVPFIAGPFLRVSVEALDRVEAGAFVGLARRGPVLVAAPVLLLGAVAPYAVRLSVRDGRGGRPGRRAPVRDLDARQPRGVFLSALVLDPARGHAAARSCRSPCRSRSSPCPRSGGASCLAPARARRADRDPGRDGEGDRRRAVIWDEETEYQYARVVQATTASAARAQRGPGDPLRVPARRVADRRLLGRDARAALSRRARARRGRSRSSATPRARRPARTGTSSRARRVDAVEIDGALTDVGRRLFDLRGPNLHLHTADARPFPAADRRKFDLIVVDAYRQPYIPF